MHVQDHERADALPLQLRQLPPHQLDQVVQLLRALVGVPPHSLAVRLLDRLLHLQCPVHLPDDDGGHPRPLEHPLLPGDCRVRLVGLDGLVHHRVLHQVLRLHQPLLHGSPRSRRVQSARPGDELALGGDHAMDDELVVELELGDGLEALLEMRLHPRRVFGLCKDLQKLVVGEEEEAREEEPLLLEVRVETLVDQLQQLERVLQTVQQPVSPREVQYLGVLNAAAGRVSERPVDLDEPVGLCWHLLLDVVGREDGFQVEPLRLHFEPDVDDVLGDDKEVLPVLGPVLKGFDVGRRQHCLRLHDLIVQDGLDLVDAGAGEDGSSRVTVRSHHKHRLLPVRQLLVEVLLQRVLLARSVADLLELGQVRV
mmetsp:Transcript_1739/g.3714  ORF Transcript_1739/g.3714 Transcript_1739/m.3714 type:complete len:368 (-) Transcript_1739:3081-4184(-)